MMMVENTFLSFEQGELTSGKETLMKKPSEPVENYQLKITLRGSKPPIWRRFVVPETIKMNHLHEVIQAVMGWCDEHLHAFDVGGERYTALTRDGIDLDMEGEDESRFRLCDVIDGLKSKFAYQYDFGDDWEHQLVLEKILPAPESKAFVCVAGKGASPPEDCGGIWGYYHLLEVLADADDPEHDDMKEWVGGKIDPDEFDLEAVNKSLAAVRSRYARRKP
jgi:hypothetical protein